MFSRLQKCQIDDAVSRDASSASSCWWPGMARSSLHGGDGIADREAGIPVRRDTVFRLASVTKPFVALSALAMMDQGLIRLEDPVAATCPTSSRGLRMERHHRSRCAISSRILRA